MTAWFPPADNKSPALQPVGVYDDSAETCRAGYVIEDAAANETVSAEKTAADDKPISEKAGPASFLGDMEFVKNLPPWLQDIVRSSHFDGALVTLAAAGAGVAVGKKFPPIKNTFKAPELAGAVLGAGIAATVWWCETGGSVGKRHTAGVYFDCLPVDKLAGWHPSDSAYRR